MGRQHTGAARRCVGRRQQAQGGGRRRAAGRRELGEEELAAGEEPELDGAGWSPGEDPHVGQEA